MIYTSEQVTRYETNQKGTLQVSLFTQVSRLILKLSNRDNMEKLKEYIYIAVRLKKKEKEKEETIFLFRISTDSTVARS